MQALQAHEQDLERLLDSCYNLATKITAKEAQLVRFETETAKRKRQDEEAQQQVSKYHDALQR